MMNYRGKPSIDLTKNETTKAVGLQRYCLHCDSHYLVLLDQVDYSDWRTKHEKRHVQNAFPYLSAEQREMMISGTHPECWKEMMAPFWEDEMITQPEGGNEGD